MPIYTTIALAALAVAPASAPGQPSAEQREVLVVVAHPDDELIMAPAIAALARQGHAVTIVFAAIGDQGPGVSGLPRGAALGEVRRGEATCSAMALGAKARFLDGLDDGTLAATPQAPISSTKTFLDQIAEVYGAITPSVVLTWGHDGGYGHADHRMVSALTTQAVQSLNRDIRARVLYVGIPNAALPPVPEMTGWATTDPALLTEPIAYTPADLAAAHAAAQCHATQFPEASRKGMIALFDGTIWRGRVHFRPAF